MEPYLSYFAIAAPALALLWLTFSKRAAEKLALPALARRAWDQCQGLSALLAAVLLFWLSPRLLHWIDPTAGTFDAGYLQRPLVAGVFFFATTFFVWIAFQMEFATLNRWLDEGGFRTDWQAAPPVVRLALTFLALFGLLAAFLVCLSLVPA